MSEQFGPMPKPEILQNIRQERAHLEATLSRVSAEDMETPGVEGEWSIKDILAHIVAWEQRMIGWLQEAAAGLVPQMPEPGMTWDDLDLLNQQTYEENKARPLAEVQADFESSFQQAVQTVESIEEADLSQAERFPWRAGRPLWVMVAANTWWHYKEHGERIQAWLQKKLST